MPGNLWRKKLSLRKKDEEGKPKKMIFGMRCDRMIVEKQGKNRIIQISGRVNEMYRVEIKNGAVSFF